MNDDLQKNTKKVMSLVVAIVLLVAGVYFIMYAPDRGEIGGFSFNKLMGGLFIVYGLFRGYLLFRSINE